MDARGAIELDSLRESMEPESWDLLQRSGGKVRGYVPEYDATTRTTRLVHHSMAPLLGRGFDKPFNPRVFHDVRTREPIDWDLPPIVRRSARQRYRALVDRLVADAQQVKAVMGRYEMPASIRKQVEHVAWIKGDPGLVERIENAEREALEVYAAFLTEDAANKQREKDQGKVALDWNGHYSA